MLIKEFQLDRINVDKSSFLSFLVYGPNEGLVRDQIKKIIHNITSKNEYEVISLIETKKAGDITIVNGHTNPKRV